MGWLARLFGKEETKTTPLTLQDLDYAGQELSDVIEQKWTPQELTLHNQVSKAYDDLRRAFINLKQAQETLNQVLADRNTYADQIKEAGVAEKKFAAKLVRAKEQFKFKREDLRGKINTIGSALRRADRTSKNLANRMRAILNPLLTRLGQELEVSKQVMDINVPKKGWF